MSTTEKTKPTTVAETLRAARALIEDPERWTQRTYARSRTGRECLPRGRAAVRWCAVGALMHVDGAYQHDATLLLRFADDISIVLVNDTGTHADVLKAFDKAIAKAEATS